MRRPALLLLILLAVRPAHARSSKQVSYPIDQVWPTAIRFLRVDEAVTIIEKDRDAGYILFEIVDDKKTWPASLELVGGTDAEGRPATTVYVRIDDRPKYMADGIVDRLAKKLRDELGAPIDPPPPAEAE